MPPFLTAGPFSASNGEGRELFSDVTIELDEGELVVLDGPSGSGKTTLLRQLVGIDRTEGATRRLAGEGFPDQRLPVWRAAVTLVAQDAPMLAGTVGENLRFPFSQRNAEGRTPDGDRLGALLDASGLGAIPEDRDIRTLSGGERHRLALVRGLLWHPRVLVTDEPLAGLDEETAAQCFELLREFARQPGRAVLCVLHERAHTADADRVIRLDGAPS
jgi:putative ABC transport system ATP-binding protein